MHTIAPKAVKQAEGAPLKTGLAPPLFMGACFAHSAVNGSSLLPVLLLYYPVRQAGM